MNMPATNQGETIQYSTTYKKRKDECQFCSRRTCYNQIFRDEVPKYDEVYCYSHMNEAEKEADRILGGHGSGIVRTHRSSTGKLHRGSR